MKQNYAQSLEMQIPQENSYVELGIMDSRQYDLKEFLKKYYEFPSKNLEDIARYINFDSELKKIIYNLEKIISEEISYSKISLDFMKETDPREKILEIVIYCKLNEEMQFQKEDIISDKIIDMYPNTEKEYIILVELNV
ncbi:hypothetical protein [Methanobrevibacter sp.]|uniref:hypothetical protein n=1 Tax=Methanobrevibacter sp. TaxID=66852 RepID=UPI00386A070E